MRNPIVKKKKFTPMTRECALLENAKIFARKIRPTAEEINIFRELFYTLVPKSSAQDLETTASVLAASQFTPRPVAMYLAMERIQIASPMLLLSPVFNDSDLMAISSNRPRSYVDVIARRDGISDAVRAHLNNLQNKNTAPDNFVHQIPSTTVEDKPNKSVDKSSELIKLANKGGRLEYSSKASARTTYPISFEQTLIDQLKDRQYDAFKQTIAKHTGLTVNLLSKFIDSEDIGKIAALYKALDIKPTIAARLLLMTSSNLGRDSKVFNAVFNQYANLNITECKQQFIHLGANFSSRNEQQNTDVNHPHFSKLVQERRRSILNEENISNEHGILEDDQYHLSAS